jgi:hypothetical protein
MWIIGQVTLVTWKLDRIDRIYSIYYKAYIAIHVSFNVTL